MQYDEQPVKTIDYELSLVSSLCCLICNNAFNKLVGICVDGDLRAIEIVQPETKNVPSSIKARSSILKEVNMLPGPIHASTVTKVHFGVIASLTSLRLTGKAGSALIISGGCDGTIRAWKDSLTITSNAPSSVKSCLSVLDFESAITALGSLPGSPMFAAGTASGVLFFIYASRTEASKGQASSNSNVNMKVVKWEKLAKGAITFISCNKVSSKLASGCYSTGAIYVVATLPNDLTVKAFANIESRISSVFWCPKNHSELLVSSAKGDIFCFDTSTMTSFPESMKPMWHCKLNGVEELVSLVELPQKDNDRYFCATHNGLKGIECFSMTYDGDISRSPTITSIARIIGGMSAPINLVTNCDTGVIIQGGYGGDISIYETYHKKEIKFHDVGCIHASSVTALTFNSDGSRVYTSGADGSFFVFSITGSSGYKPLLSSNYYDALQAEASHTLPTLTMQKESLCWLQSTKNKLAAKINAEASFDKEAIQSKLTNIRNGLSIILKENDNKNELEKLNKDEMIVDEDGMRTLKATTVQNTNDLKSRIEESNNSKNMIASHIRRDYWEVMTVHVKQINGLTPKSQISIETFPLLKLHSTELKHIRLAKYLRRCEIAHIQQNSNKASAKGLCWGSLLGELPTRKMFSINKVNQYLPDEHSLFLITHEELSKKNEQPLPSSTHRRSDHINEEEDDFDPFVYIDGDSPTNMLLYPPLSVRTDSQRRTQMILIKDFIRSVKVEFNKQFQNAWKEKEVAIGNLAKKNDRIKDILRDLEKDESCFEPKFSSSETPELLFDLGFYENAGQNISKNKKDEGNIDLITNISETVYFRGLKHMMNGTLEVAKQITSIKTLERETWMDEVPVQDMDASQLRELEEFNAQVKINAEALENHHKILEVELKKLRVESGDTISMFDDKLQKLLSERKSIKRLTTSLELYVLNLGNSIVEKEQTILSLRDHNSRLDTINKKREKILLLSKGFNEELLRLNEALNKITLEDKSLEKSFRKNIQKSSPVSLDQDNVKMLLHLYRLRDKMGKGSRLHKKIHSARNRNTMESINRSIIGRYSGRETRSSSGASFQNSVSSEMPGKDNVDSPGSKQAWDFQMALKEAKDFVNESSYCPNDPFNDSDIIRPDSNQYSDEDVGFIKPLSSNLIPEGFDVSKQAWKALQDLRNEKIKKEESIKAATRRVKSMKVQCDMVEEELQQLDLDIQHMHVKGNGMIMAQKRYSENPCVVVYLKQGKNEVKQVGMGQGFQNSSLLHLDVIEEINKKIKSLWNERMKILDSMTNFRKKINYMEWNKEYLDMMHNHTRELFTDIHLMRVTKQLKSLISSEYVHETPNMSHKKVKKEQGTKVNTKRGNQKIVHLEEEIKKLERKASSRNQENDKLRLQLVQLEKNVSIRENMYQKIYEKWEADPVSENKMKQIMTRQKLVDTVRSQEKELSTLREELDILRQRTFPSFVCATRDFLANPDVS